MVSLEEVKNNRDSFLSKNPKYGIDALKKAKGVKDYHELSKKLGCPITKASTIINELIWGKLYEKSKKGTLKKTKEFIRVGIKPLTNNIQNSEKNIRTRKTRKINVKHIKKEIEEYILNNFKIIKNPFNRDSNKKLSDTQLKKSADILFSVLDSSLNFDRLEGLGFRFYESTADYFSKSRMKKAEMTNSFSSLIKNFEPYIKKLVLYKTKDFEKAKLSLDKKLLEFIISFESNLNNANPDYWKDKNIKESCIRYVYPFRHIEAHEARDWDVFEIEKSIYYMFASIILINLET